jgi:hypothetical protein
MSSCKTYHFCDDYGWHTFIAFSPDHAARQYARVLGWKHGVYRLSDLADRILAGGGFLSFYQDSDLLYSKSSRAR